MYKQIGQTLFIVTRPLRQKLLKDSRINGIAGVVPYLPNMGLYETTNGFFAFYRNYCDQSFKDSEKSAPALMMPDEDAEIKLKEYRSNPANERMYKILELEMEVMRQNNEKVPENMKPRHWYELTQLDTRSKRKKYLSFVWGIEKKKENQLMAKAEKRKEIAERPPTDDIYKLGGNTMFLRFYETTINRMYNARLINRMVFGQPIVLDCGYEAHMTRYEIKNCSRQLQFTFAANRAHDDPFDMYLCNADPSGELMKGLHRFIPGLYGSDFPLNVKSKSYLDIFDKSRLVYLTPHTQKEMLEFDHDAIYIIGAFVDKATNKPVSFAKAKKEGLKMAKLPLDRYLKWGSSSGKNLTLNAVLNILLDLRLTGSWTEALKNVPTRKLGITQENAQKKHSLSFDNDDLIEFNEKMDDKSLRVPERETKKRFDSNSNLRSGYRSSKPKYDMDLEDTDFTRQGRAKLKKNWKN